MGRILERLAAIGSTALCRVLLPLLLAGCGGGSQSALNPAGPQSARIYRLWIFFLIITASVYVLVLAFTLLSLRHRSSGDDTILRVDTGQEMKIATIVSALVAVTAVILFVMMLAEFLAGRDINALAKEKDIMHVQIIGHQWWWDVTYQNGKASDYVNTANEIHIPVGRTVRFDLKSSDVIHSFWAPNLHGKKDLVPGQPTSIYLKASEPGSYIGQCAEFCGIQHAHMRFLIIAESRDKFDQWYQSQLQPAGEPADDLQKHGRQVFLTSTCVMCHRVAGTIAAARLGPDLTHIASAQYIGAGRLTNQVERLRDWVVNPQRHKPGVKMPQNILPPEDLKALLAYLEHLK